MRILDQVYRLCGALAALFLVMIGALVLTQVVGRMMGIQIRDTDVLSGFAMAAFSFLALAYTLRSGGHIRVNLVISRFHGRLRRVAEGWCLIFAIVSIGFFAWFTLHMVVRSYQFNDISQGMIGIPLWIPQIGMLVGVVLLEVAFIEEGVRFLQGRKQTYSDTDDGTEIE